MAPPFIVMNFRPIYAHPQPPAKIIALGSPPYFMQFFLCSFAFLCKVTHRGSITTVNRLRKLSITSVVGHNESGTPLTWKTGGVDTIEYCLFTKGWPQTWSSKFLERLCFRVNFKKLSWILLF